MLNTRLVPLPEVKSWGELLEQQRLKLSEALGREVTKAEIAREAKIHAQQISQMYHRNNKRPPHPETIRKLVSAYNRIFSQDTQKAEPFWTVGTALRAFNYDMTEVESVELDEAGNASRFNSQTGNWESVRFELEEITNVIEFLSKRMERLKLQISDK